MPTEQLWFTVPVSGLVSVLHARHAAPADAGLWLQWAVSSWCQRTAHWGWLSPPQQPSLNQVELLAQGDTVFDILDRQAHEDVRKQLLLAQEEPGRGKGDRGCHLTDAAALLWPLVAVVRKPGLASSAGSRPKEPLSSSDWFVSLQKSHLLARCTHPKPSGCSMGGIEPWQCTGALQPSASQPPPPPQCSWPSAPWWHSCPQMVMLVPMMTYSRARTS